MGKWKSRRFCGISGLPPWSAPRIRRVDHTKFAFCESWFCEAGGWPRVGILILVDIGIVERISLRHFSGKYRETEGAPGSIIDPGSWGDVFLRGARDAGGTKALLRERPSAFYDVQLLAVAAASIETRQDRRLRWSMRKAAAGLPHSKLPGGGSRGRQPRRTPVH